MEKLFELKRDIRTPNRYIRAGERRTMKEWEMEFPNLRMIKNSEWFIDLTEPGEMDTRLARKIVDEVFEQQGLHSIGYKMAALEAIEEYTKRTNKN